MLPLNIVPTAKAWFYHVCICGANVNVILNQNRLYHVDADVWELVQYFTSIKKI